jgi:hypothetical protein
MILTGGPRQSEREGEGQVGLGWFGLLGWYRPGSAQAAPFLYFFSSSFFFYFSDFCFVCLKTFLFCFGELLIFLNF